MSFRTLVLVRHGHNRADALTPLGRRQAAHTARRLTGLPLTSIHCSTMRRAVDTARILGRNFRNTPVSRAHILRECLPTKPVPPGVRFVEVPAAMIRRGRKRVDRAFRRYFRPPGRGDSCDLIVAHGNVIRYLLCRSLKLDGFPWWTLGTCHCGITILRITSAGETILDSYNDTGHLPAKLRTSGTVRDP